MFDGAELDEQVGLVLAEQELDDEQEMSDGGLVDGVDVLKVSSFAS